MAKVETRAKDQFGSINPMHLDAAADDDATDDDDVEDVDADDEAEDEEAAKQVNFGGGGGGADIVTFTFKDIRRKGGSAWWVLVISQISDQASPNHI